MKDVFFGNVSAVVHEASKAFYEWEKERFAGMDSGMSDDDRIIWMQGYVYLYKQMREKQNEST
jgi:hypothetical protein